MSDCDVCIGGCDEPLAGYESQMVTSDEPRCCCECREVIPSGVAYERANGEYFGETYTYETCQSCVEIRDVFTCGMGWIFESLWEDMQEIAFPNLTTASPCFRELTPANKARVLDKWREWKFRGAE